MPSSIGVDEHNAEIDDGALAGVYLQAVVGVWVLPQSVPLLLLQHREWRQHQAAVGSPRLMARGLRRADRDLPNARVRLSGLSGGARAPKAKRKGGGRLLTRPGVIFFPATSGRTVGIRSSLFPAWPPVETRF